MLSLDHPATLLKHSDLLWKCYLHVQSILLQKPPVYKGHAPNYQDLSYNHRYESPQTWFCLKNANINPCEH